MVVQGKKAVRTVDLPLPVAPMTLERVSARLPRDGKVHTQS